jgi:hypothetical protein
MGQSGDCGRTGGHPQNPRAIFGKNLGVTRERVRQIEKRALSKIKEALSSEEGGALDTEESMG